MVVKDNPSATTQQLTGAQAQETGPPNRVLVGEATIQYFADSATQLVTQAKVEFKTIEDGIRQDAKAWECEIQPENDTYAMTMPDGSTVHNGKSLWEMLVRSLRTAQDRFLSGVL